MFFRAVFSTNLLTKPWDWLLIQTEKQSVQLSLIRINIWSYWKNVSRWTLEYNYFLTVPWCICLHTFYVLQMCVCLFISYILQTGQTKCSSNVFRALFLGVSSRQNRHYTHWLLWWHYSGRSDCTMHVLISKCTCKCNIWNSLGFI